MYRAANGRLRLWAIKWNTSWECQRHGLVSRPRMAHVFGIGKQYTDLDIIVPTLWQKNDLHHRVRSRDIGFPGIQLHNLSLHIFCILHYQGWADCFKMFGNLFTNPKIHYTRGSLVCSCQIDSKLRGYAKVKGCSLCVVPNNTTFQRKLRSARLCKLAVTWLFTRLVGIRIFYFLELRHS